MTAHLCVCIGSCPEDFLPEFAISREALLLQFGPMLVTPQSNLLLLPLAQVLQQLLRDTCRSLRLLLLRAMATRVAPCERVRSMVEERLRNPKP